MEPQLAMILYITKYSFVFKNILDKHCPNWNTLSTCDIKFLYTNIQYDLFYARGEYLTEK